MSTTTTTTNNRRRPNKTIVNETVVINKRAGRRRRRSKNQNNNNNYVNNNMRTRGRVPFRRDMRVNTRSRNNYISRIRKDPYLFRNDALTLKYKMDTPYHKLFLHYAAAILMPEAVTKQLGSVRIPDLSMLPCAVQQVRTNFQIAPDSNGSFGMIHFPTMFEGYNIVDVSALLPVSCAVQVGTTVIPASASTPFSIWQYDDYSALASVYRFISMAIRITYTGKVLDKSGRLASACMPPFAQNVNSYNELADYTYSYTTQAGKGLRQVWYPGDYKSFEQVTPQTTFGFDEIPGIYVYGAGLPPSTLNEDDTPNYNFVLDATIVANFEVYGTASILGPISVPSQANARALDTANVAVSKALATGGTASTIENVAEEAALSLAGPLGEAASSLLPEIPSETKSALLKTAVELIPAFLSG